MYVEITKEAFYKLKPPSVPCFLVESKEVCNKYHYHSHGCELLWIDNFVSGVMQFYIRDINA